ncbi:nucleoside diphosphate kinase [Gonapodya prolifera JEL478]|uniref:Nucleoside diphosphate kinase n=1 Tax=Gonapodya prolifera (strain JEL478) TaxID=1344416 RepID=A0A139AWG9_GONPJ|nr:nucleoside diphosphate kinase [Gonapodya prolifera JEL478]|eukprot:KXS21070.1 nucleoside diphosphate kinase [Gonapodya prolifera JEL478]
MSRGINAVDAKITSADRWDDEMAKPGLLVADVFSSWVGPCEAVLATFKKLKTENIEDVRFVQVQSENIDALAKYRDKSCPHVLVLFSGVVLRVIRGPNAPLIERTVKEQIDLEKRGQPHKPYEDAGSSPILDAPGDISGSTLKLDPPAEGRDRTVAMIKPDAMNPAVVEQILNILSMNRFDVVKKRRVWLSNENVRQLYKEHEGRPYFEELMGYISSAPLLALILERENAIEALREVAGPANSKRAKEEFPKSIRGMFGTDQSRNAIHTAATAAEAAYEMEYLFGKEVKTFEESESADEPSATLARTFALIKPDAIAQGKMEDILQLILAHGYEIEKKKEVYISQDMAAEFFRKIQDKPYYQPAVNLLTSASASSLALILRGDNVISGWKEMIGPFDPTKAKEVSPNSIRALYGTDEIKNAVHGSDDEECAVREINLFFPKRPSMMNVRPMTGRQVDRPERTLGLIKPDGYPVHKEDIFARIKTAGFEVVCEKEFTFDRKVAETFYQEHKERPFYEELVTWMSSAPISAFVLEKVGAVRAWRDLMGPTNPQKAREEAPDSLRALFGSEAPRNAVHGSDSQQSAQREITLLFPDVSPVPPKPTQIVEEEAKASEKVDPPRAAAEQPAPAPAPADSNAPIAEQSPATDPASSAPTEPSEAKPADPAQDSTAPQDAAPAPIAAAEKVTSSRASLHKSQTLAEGQVVPKSQHGSQNLVSTAP